MFFKSIKIWLLICIGTELGMDLVAQSYNYNVLKLEILKLVIYITCYVVLNVFLIIKKVDENVIYGINGGVSLILSSVLGTVSLIIVLKSIRSMSWIVFLFLYIGVIFFCFMWDKNNTSSEEKEEKDNSTTAKVLGGGSALFAISFVRAAPDNVRRVEYVIFYMVTLWLFLIIGNSLFVKYKKELKNIFTLNNKDCN